MHTRSQNFIDMIQLGTAHSRGLQSRDVLNDAFDVIVIGSGAAGAIAASTFVHAGLRTLILEEGPKLTSTARNKDVDDNSELAIAGNLAQGWSSHGWPWSTRNLGGGTIFYGGASFRYTDFDFDPTERLQIRGLPIKWPIDARELDPYYDELESALSIDYVSYQYPPQRAPDTLSMPGEYLWRGGDALNLSPRQTPIAIDRRRCDKCSLCISAQCTRGAKRDVVSSFFSRIANNSNVVIITEVKAISLLQEKPNSAYAVRCLDTTTGEVCLIRGARFVLACNAIQTAALLLRSTSVYSLNGLGNQHDVVGRGLCMKLSEYSEGVVPVASDDIANHPIGYKGPFSTVCSLAHYLDNKCPTGVGGLIYEAKHDDWSRLEGKGVILRLETILADQPSLANRVRLSNVTDAWGLPKLVIDYTPNPVDLSRLEYMVSRSSDWLTSAGAENITREASNFAIGSTHLHGTCRAGNDPRTSVVNRDGKIHSLDNVYVADGSYMPYPGGLNPTLTIQANALRIARCILKDF